MSLCVKVKQCFVGIAWCRLRIHSISCESIFQKETPNYLSAGVPPATMVAIRSFAFAALRRGWSLEVCDAKAAYIQCPLDRVGRPRTFVRRRPGLLG